MNILYLANHLNVGGITSYIFSLARGLKKKGHHIYLTASPGDRLDRFLDEGVGYLRVPLKTKQEFNPQVFFSVFKVLSFIEEKKIEIIHSNTRVTQVLGSILSKYSGKVHISTCHGFFKNRLSRRIFPCWGKKVIAISDSVKEHLTNDFLLDDESIELIYNGIDLSRFISEGSFSKNALRQRFGLKGEPVIGIIARLSEVKGHIYLIKAMKEILRFYPKAQLFIAGDGKIKDDLVKFSRSFGIIDNIVFVPEVSDTLEALSVMDVFVMPSLNEGLGLSLMEAMAFGLPVVGSNVGGIKSLIQDGYSGVLVPAADHLSIAQAVTGILKDPKRAQYLGGNARNFINLKFSEDEMVSKTEKLYKKCLTEN